MNSEQLRSAIPALRPAGRLRRLTPLQAALIMMIRAVRVIGPAEAGARPKLSNRRFLT
jgi:hypothetical protein